MGSLCNNHDKSRSWNSSILLISLDPLWMVTGWYLWLNTISHLEKLKIQLFEKLKGFIVLFLVIGMPFEAFVMLRYVSYIPSFFRSFNMKGCCILSKAFCFCWDYQVISVLESSYIIYNNYWLTYIEPSHISGMRVAWSWWMAFLMCSWIWFASILLEKKIAFKCTNEIVTFFWCFMCLYVLYDRCYKYSFKKFKLQNFWEVWITGFHWHLDPVIWGSPLLILLQTRLQGLSCKEILRCDVKLSLWLYYRK